MGQPCPERTRRQDRLGGGSAAHWQWLYLAALVVGAVLGATIHRGWLVALLLARPTWPSRWGGWFGIPIDHVAGSAHWRVRHARLGPHLGSDHRPLLAKLTLADSAAGKCPP